MSELLLEESVNQRKLQTRHFRSCVGVFQGGGCRGPALAGALATAEERGVTFAQVAGASAGAILAALVGSGMKSKAIITHLENLDFPSLLRPPIVVRKGSLGQTIAKGMSFVIPQVDVFKRIFYSMGLHSGKGIEEWVEAQLRAQLELNRPVTFEDLPIETWILAANLKTRQPEVWSQTRTPSSLVANAVAASCAIPIFFQPVEGRFVDGGILSNLPAFLFNSTWSPKSDRLGERILAFVLESDSTVSYEGDSLGFLLSAIANTAVDGSVALQLSMQRDVHYIRINTGAVKATDFNSMTEKSVSELVNRGRSAASVFFDNEKGSIQPESVDVCTDRDDAYSRITARLRNIRTLDIAQKNTKFVFDLYPSLLFLRLNDIPIHVVLSELRPTDHDEESEDERHRREVLRQLGCNIVEVPDQQYNAFLMNGQAQDRKSSGAAVVLLDAAAREKVGHYAAYYTAGAHLTVIKLLDAFFGSVKWGLNAGRPKLCPLADNARLIDCLRGVEQYAPVDRTITIEKVMVTDVVPLTKWVRSFKYYQMEELLAECEKINLEIGRPAEVLYGDGTSSILTPPVFERSGKTLHALEGTTRLTIARDGGQLSLWAAVVDGVSDPLPAAEQKLDDVRISLRRRKGKDRYEGFVLDRYRHIERAVHQGKGPRLE